MILYILRRWKYKTRFFFRHFYKRWYWKKQFRLLWTFPRRFVYNTKARVRAFRRWIGLDPLYVPKDAFGRPFPLEHVTSCVGKGWEELVTDLYRTCQYYDVDITQVKEKFGGLRFYVGAAPSFVHNKIAYYDYKSYRICENCGNPGEPNNARWIKTLCNNCDRVERRKSHELEHLLTDEALEDWNEKVESGEVARTFEKFIDMLKGI